MFTAGKAFPARSVAPPQNKTAQSIVLSRSSTSIARLHLRCQNFHHLENRVDLIFPCYAPTVLFFHEGHHFN